MKIVAEYDFNNGKAIVEARYMLELRQIIHVVRGVHAPSCQTRPSSQSLIASKLVYAPQDLHKQFQHEFAKDKNGTWAPSKITCDYSAYGTYLPGYQALMDKGKPQPYRQMDFVKPGKKLGVAVQLGQVAIAGYNACSQMTIFSNLGIIDTGIEILPIQHLAYQMNNPVPHFEQFVWDLGQRGVSNIDVPILILGIDV